MIFRVSEVELKSAVITIHLVKSEMKPLVLVYSPSSFFHHSPSGLSFIIQADSLWFLHRGV